MVSRVLLTNNESRIIGVHNDPVYITDYSANADIFGRKRISSPQTLFTTSFNVDKKDLFWSEIVVGGATSTYNENQACIDMAVTTASGDRVLRQSKEYFIYEPGRSQQGIFTVVFGAGQDNCKQILGLYDDENGVFIMMNGTTFSVGKRSSVTGSVVDTIIPQSSFSEDKLDGLGLSGFTLDPTKAQIFYIEYQWLGVGSIRFGVYNQGSIIYFHHIHHSNNVNSVYMKRGTLPARYEIINSALIGSATTMKQICCAISSEAGYVPLGVKRSADTGTTARTAGSGIELPLIAIRLKSTHIRSAVIPETFSLVATSVDNFRYRVTLNPTIVAGTFTSLASNSAVEINTTATGMTGGSVVISDGYVSNQIRSTFVSEIESLLKMVADISGTSDSIVLSARAVPNASINLFASLEWKEFL